LLLATTLIALAGESPSAAADPGTVDVCGPINFYSPATATTNNQLGIAGVTYQLVLRGTVPPELGARSTGLNPEVVRLTGRLVEGINTVADYTVVRVSGCPGLPNTSTSAASEATGALEVCGTLRAHIAATATADGSLSIGSRTYPIASAVTAGNGGVEVSVGRDLCVAASIGLTSGRLVRYLFFTMLTGDRVCGNLVRPPTTESFAMRADFGELTLLRSTSALAIDNPGMRACYAFQVDSASGDLVATARMPVRDTFSDREHLTKCGTVKAYVPATAANSGQITVGSRLFRIAAGTNYTGDPAGSRIDRTTIGQAMCLTSTLDIVGAIVEYVTQEMYPSISAAASAYTPPSGSGSGVAVLSYVSRYELRIPAAIDAAIDVARGTYCYSTAVDASGDITASAVLTCPSGNVVGAAGATTPSPTTAPPPTTAASVPTASTTATPASSNVALSSPSPQPGATGESSTLLPIGIALLAGAAVLAVYLMRRSRVS
jgi:hypothetical protein